MICFNRYNFIVFQLNNFLAMKYFSLILIILILNSVFTHSVLANEFKSLSPDNTSQEDMLIKAKRKISTSAIKDIEPTIKDWLEFYNLDISTFYLGENYQYENTVVDEGIYFREFDPETDDVYIPQMFDYSPSQQKYIDFQEVYKKGNDYFWAGRDDCQEIYLVDRKLKTHKLINWFGTMQLLEAVFWQNENSFIILGIYESSNVDSYFIEKVTLGQNINMVEIYYHETNHEHFNTGYFIKFLKSKGVIIEYE